MYSLCCNGFVIGDDEDQPDLKNLLKNKKRVFEAPRAQNYYHVEYYLLPEEDELSKTDIVTYGMAAKLYMERHDARVIKTWQDGEITWIAWAHRLTLFLLLLLAVVTQNRFDDYYGLISQFLFTF